MIVTAVKTQEGSDDLYKKFTLSRSYLDTVYAVRNQKSLQQSLAGIRALLLLLESMGVAPESVKLERNERGKPIIAESDMEFNISHSGELAVCALSNTPVGIDIEKVRYIRNADELANRFFGEEERKAFGRAESEEKEKRFFEIWTKKEAYLKLLGCGISTQLNKIDVWSYPITLAYIADEETKDMYVVAVAGEGEIRVIGGRKWQI